MEDFTWLEFVTRIAQLEERLSTDQEALGSIPSRGEIFRCHNMSIINVKKVIVPQELKNILLEFTIAYLLEQPPDVIDFGYDFFSKLQETRRTTPQSVDTVEVTVKESYDQERAGHRRITVFAEPYNPEDDSDESEEISYPKTDDQRRRLLTTNKDCLLFRCLEEEHINKVVGAMFEKTVFAGEYVIRQGDDGDNFYVIEGGTFNAFVHDQVTGQDIHVKTYENTGSFGELALMYNMPRKATVQAATDGYLWGLDRTTFRKIVLKGAYKKRQMYEYLLDSVPLLKQLTQYERMDVADALISRTYEDGEVIIRQGDEADGMYLIEDGVVLITVKGEKGHEVELKRLEKGDYFGELALITHKPRAASAYAVGFAKCAFLDTGAFERLLGPCMQIMQRNIDEYGQQLTELEQK